MLAQLTHGSVDDLLLAADQTHSAAERTILLRRVLKTGTPYAAYQVAIRQYYVGEAERVVCEHGDYNTICQFALDVPGANVNRLGYAVAAMREPAKAMMFARVFKPTDIEELQYVVALAAMEEQTAQMGVIFAVHVPGANIDILQDAVIRSKSEPGIYSFAAQVKGANLRVLETAIEDNLLTLAALWTAQEVKGINHVRMEHVLIQSGSTDECFQYATKVPFAPFQRLMQRALDFATTIAIVGDNETAAALYGFAEATKNVNQIGEIYNALVDTRWDHVAQRIAKNFVFARQTTQRVLGASMNSTVQVKTCSVCRETKPVTSFNSAGHKKAPARVRGECALCTVVKTTRRHEKRKNADPYGWALARKRMAVRWEYGITLEEVSGMLLAQNNACAICRRSFTEVKQRIDHCHSTGVVRGILCVSCNIGLGVFKDNPDLLEKAACYLRTYD